MPRSVKRRGSANGGDLRAARIAETEEKIVRSAAELFQQHGYAATTLAAVAEAAQVADRTVYVRFGTKAALLKRVVDVAVAGDTAPVDVVGRDWFQAALGAPTAAERITALARGCREMMSRAGGVLAVAQQAQASEPLLAQAMQSAREGTRDASRRFWSRLADDGLLPAGCDVTWLTDTTALLVAAETYLLRVRMLSGDLDDYESWLVSVLCKLIDADDARP